MTQCEYCANAVWDTGDYSVGIPAYIDQCKNLDVDKFNETYFDMFTGIKDHCSFFLVQYQLEYEKIRCPNCNSPKNKLIELTECCCQANFQCNECEYLFVADLPY